MKKKRLGTAALVAHNGFVCTRMSRAKLSKIDSLYAYTQYLVGDTFLTDAEIDEIVMSF